MQESSFQYQLDQHKTYNNESDLSHNLLLNPISIEQGLKRKIEEDLNSKQSDENVKKMKIENHLSKNEPIDFHLTFDPHTLSIENPETDDAQMSQERAMLEAMEEGLRSLDDDTSDEEGSSDQENINSKQLLKAMINKTIPIQASLFDVERKAKAWAETQPKLKNLDNNLNNVFKLYSLNPNDDDTPIAFYKEGNGNKKASIIMETLMWEIAVLLDVEKWFAPTKRTVLMTKTRKIREGSIQKTQKGVTLSKYFTTPHNPESKISKKQIIQATLITCLFGMFDAHERNMIVNPARDIIFFDNTCSMPSSNVALKRNGDDTLECPYRSGLFQFDEYYETLDEPNRDCIKIEVDKYKNSINALEKYLRSPRKDYELSTLPKGWWNTNDSMEALRERVKNLSEAIEKPEVKNLRDLVFYVNPTFKCLSAVNLIHQSISEISSHRTLSEELKKNILSRSHDIEASLKRLINHNIDPALVLTWCQDPSLTFDSILEKGCDEFLQRKNKSFSEVNKHKNELSLKLDQIINEYKVTAKVDLKDC